MSALGIVFSNIREKLVPEITKHRIMASVPFGGRYRLIDFVLSNMTNSGITKIGIITRRNYQNFMDHIGTGKAWDLARRRGGIRLLQPYGEDIQNGETENRLETLRGILHYLENADEEYVIITDSEVVCTISYTEMLEAHKESGADVTVLYKKHEKEEKWNSKRIGFTLDQSNRVKEIRESDENEKNEALYLGTLIIKREYLIKQILAAPKKGYNRLFDFWKDHMDEINIVGYEFTEFATFIDSLKSYMNSNLQLLDGGVREELFGKPYQPVYTSVNDSPATIYGPDAEVENSIIADGCVINGKVKNSVIFRGVKVEKNAEVTNSIVMQDSMIGKHASLNHIVMDRKVVIGDQRTLCGHETHPFFIEKGSMI
ncbi:MAG: glucose-1-phosphate adenylyltransferase subunit GlgD [Bacillus sp. (in: firmicutes)]